MTYIAKRGGNYLTPRPKGEARDQAGEGLRRGLGRGFPLSLNLYKNHIILLVILRVEIDPNDILDISRYT